MINKAILLGYAAAAPERLSMREDCEAVKFRLATSMFVKKEKVTQWHNIAVFNPTLAKRALERIDKGSKVYVEGQITSKTVNDKIYHSIVLPNYGGELLVLDRQLEHQDIQQKTQNISVDFEDDIPF